MGVLAPAAAEHLDGHDLPGPRVVAAEHPAETAGRDPVQQPVAAQEVAVGVALEELGGLEGGEEVKAVVQLMPNIEPCDQIARELIEFCRGNLAHLKCPRSIDFVAELPRLPTGKLYKRELRDRYWKDHYNRIV